MHGQKVDSRKMTCLKMLADYYRKRKGTSVEDVDLGVLIDDNTENYARAGSSIGQEGTDASEEGNMSTAAVLVPRTNGVDANGVTEATFSSLVHVIENIKKKIQVRRMGSEKGSEPLQREGHDNETIETDDPMHVETRRTREPDANATTSWGDAARLMAIVNEKKQGGSATSLNEIARSDTVHTASEESGPTTSEEKKLTDSGTVSIAQGSRDSKSTDSDTVSSDSKSTDSDTVRIAQASRDSESTDSDTVRIAQDSRDSESADSDTVSSDSESTDSDTVSSDSTDSVSSDSESTDSYTVKIAQDSIDSTKSEEVVRRSEAAMLT